MPRNVKGVIYLLHFEPAYKHAKHYLGWGADRTWLERLLQQQGGLAGCANLVKVAIEAGSIVRVARIWEGMDRNQERKWKSHSKVPKCPICRKAKKCSTAQSNTTKLTNSGTSSANPQPL